MLFTSAIPVITLPAALKAAFNNVGAVLSEAIIDVASEIFPVISFAVTLTVSLLVNAVVNVTE